MFCGSAGSESEVEVADLTTARTGRLIELATVRVNVPVVLPMTIESGETDGVPQV